MTLKAKLFIDGQRNHTCKQLQGSGIKVGKDGFFDEQRSYHIIIFFYIISNFMFTS